MSATRTEPAVFVLGSERLLAIETATGVALSGLTTTRPMWLELRD